MVKMLICDDEAGLRTVIKRYAIFEGHEVVEAGDGLEAVELCQNNGFDIIIMDIMMPQLDGFSAVQVEMAPKQYDLLFFLIRNKNIAVPRERILSEVWGYDYMGDDRTLDTHMKLLRKSIEPYGTLIRTIRGVGYR